MFQIRRSKVLVTYRFLDLVVRGDGTVPLLEDAIGPRQEFQEFVQLFKDYRLLALL